MEQTKRKKGDSIHLLSVDGDTPLKLSQISTGGGGGTRPHYHGATTFTPTQQTQVAQTSGLIVDADIIINPIPSNYGRITWNGAFLTVS